jgi:hypothetical protein
LTIRRGCDYFGVSKSVALASIPENSGGYCVAPSLSHVTTTIGSY